MTPGELLKGSVHAEPVYYPNAGMFVRYLVRRLGIKICNDLFTVRQDNFISEFQRLSGITWNELEQDYMEWLNTR